MPADSLQAYSFANTWHNNIRKVKYMDKLFVVSPAYCKAEPVDTTAIIELLRKYAGYSCDHYIIADKPIHDWGADTIPIGDLDFVRAALCHALNRDANMTPIEIPDPLLPFCGRKYVRLKGKDIIGTQYADPEKYFIKDITELKHWNSLMQMTDVSDQIDPRRKYSVSAKILILSEYRVFVCRGHVLGVQNYLGDLLAFPSSGTIRAMIKAYDTINHPKSYTLDIAVTAKSETVPLEESHTIFSKLSAHVGAGSYLSAQVVNYSDPEGSKLAVKEYRGGGDCLDLPHSYRITGLLTKPAF